MRVHEGNFAYDIEPHRDPATELVSGWKFRVFRVRPLETVVRSGEAKTREEAEKLAKKAMQVIQEESASNAA